MRIPTLAVVPRTAVDLTLRTARLPLRTLAAVTRKDPGAWAPTLVFDTIDASLRQLAGGLLHDEALVASGRREQLRVERLGEAVAAEKRAATVRSEADQRLAEQRGEADRRREQVERRAAEEHDRVEAARAEAVDAEERELAAQAQAVREEAGVHALDEQLERSRRRRRAAAG